MKYLILTDTHDKGKNPINRIGSYHTDILNKLREIVKIAHKNNVDTIIHGGDVFDSPFVSNTVADDFIDILESFQGNVKILPGNHDMIGKNWELSKTSILAHVFRRSDKIKLFSKEKSKNLTIEGFPYYYGIEKEINKNGLITKDKSDFKIAIIHALITPFKLMDIISHSFLDNIKSNFDVIIVGHNHSQYGEIKKNNTNFVFPGCIGRRKIDEVDIKPNVILLDSKKENLELIELKNVKSKKDCFNLEKVKEKKQFENELDKFIESLDDVKFKELNLKDIVMDIGKKENIDKNIINMILERI